MHAALTVLMKFDLISFVPWSICPAAPVPRWYQWRQRWTQAARRSRSQVFPVLLAKNSFEYVKFWFDRLMTCFRSITFYPLILMTQLSSPPGAHRTQFPLQWDENACFVKVRKRMDIAVQIEILCVNVLLTQPWHLKCERTKICW